MTQLRQLLSQAKSDPAAVEGLRKAAIDYIARKFSNVAESGTSEQKLLSSANFQKLVRDFEPNLSVLFKPEQVNTLRAIARDMELSDRSVQATRIKGSPGTAKDVLPFLNKGQKESLTHTGLLVGALEALSLAYEHGGIETAAKMAVPIGGAAAFKYWRGTGIDKVQNMVREALLDPAVARQLLTKVPRDRLSVRAEIVSKAIRRSLLTTPPLMQDQRAERASGGRIGQRDYPAKRASHIERLAQRTHEKLAHDLKPLMGARDDLIAQALRVAGG